MGRHLARVVKDRLEEKYDGSAREASRRSKGLLSHQTITAMQNGDPEKSFTIQSLRLAATALELPAQQILDAYDADVQERNEGLRLPAELNALTASGRKALIEHGRFLLELERKRRRPDGRGRKPDPSG